jgi:hypothetical protein
MLAASATPVTLIPHTTQVTPLVYHTLHPTQPRNRGTRMRMCVCVRVCVCVCTPGVRAYERRARRCQRKEKEEARRG